MPTRKVTWICSVCSTEYFLYAEAVKCETQLPGTRRAMRIYIPGDVLTVRNYKPDETYDLVEVKVIRTEIGPASSGTKGLHENYVIVDKWINILDYYDDVRDCWVVEQTTRIPASKIND